MVAVDYLYWRWLEWRQPQSALEEAPDYPLVAAFVASSSAGAVPGRGQGVQSASASGRDRGGVEDVAGGGGGEADGGEAHLTYASAYQWGAAAAEVYVPARDRTRDGGFGGPGTDPPPGSVGRVEAAAATRRYY